MKNIYEILKSFGIEIPEEKKADFEKQVAENYKTVKEVDGIKTKLSNTETERDNLQKQYDVDIKKRDDDLEALKSQLEASGVDKTTLETLQAELKKQQDENANSKAAYEKQLQEQRYEFGVKEKVNGLKFSSASAKKAFLMDIMANPLQMKDGNILGFDDFVNAYKEQDADAFITEDDNNGSSGEGGNPQPRFSSKAGANVDNNQNTGAGNEPPAETSATVIW